MELKSTTEFFFQLIFECFLPILSRLVDDDVFHRFLFASSVFIIFIFIYIRDWITPSSGDYIVNLYQQTMIIVMQIRKQCKNAHFFQFCESWMYFRMLLIILANRCGVFLIPRSMYIFPSIQLANLEKVTLHWLLLKMPMFIGPGYFRASLPF